MSDTELQFRTSTFGGFPKQDVLNYIETSNQEHREQPAAVRRDLAEAEAAQAAPAAETPAAWLGAPDARFLGTMREEPNCRFHR